MRETRRQVIKNKVFKKADIENIANLLFAENKASTEIEHHSSFEIEIDCIDGSTFENDTLVLFKQGEVLDNKKAKKININYNDYEWHKNISFSIHDGGSIYNELVVTGEDHNWVNGIFRKLTEIVDAVQPQDNWFLQHKKLIRIIIALVLGKIIWSIIYSIESFILNLTAKPIQNPSDNLLIVRQFIGQYSYIIHIIISWIIPWMIGFAWTGFPMIWIYKMWPSIEFDFGPEYQKYNKKRRNRVLMICTSFILPIIISIILEIINI